MILNSSYCNTQHVHYICSTEVIIDKQADQIVIESHGYLQGVVHVTD